MAGTEMQTIKFVDGPPPENFFDAGGIEDGLNDIANGGLNELYGSNSANNWDQVTPMTGSHIPGVDTGAQNGETTFMGSGGQMKTIGSGMDSFGDSAPTGSTPYESMMRDRLLSQLSPEQTSSSADGSDTAPDQNNIDAQQVCNGSNVGYIDSNGRLNVCVYGQTSPPPSSVTVAASSGSTTGFPTLATITVTPTPGELAAARAGDEGPVGAGDAIGSGLATYSTGMSQLLEKNGVTVTSRFGIQYGLSGLVADLPGAVGGAIGLGETWADYKAGNDREAIKAGTGTVFSIAGAEAGAGAGAAIGAFFPPAEVVAPLAGALIGGISGGAIGRWVGEHVYDKIAPAGRAERPSIK